MKRLFAAALLALSSSTWALSPAELAAQLNGSPFVEADFVQDKQVAGLSRPLTSRGHMVLARDGGVLWRIASPYAVSYFLSEHRLVELAEGRREEKDASALPWLGQIAAIMHALLAADLAALERQFALELSGRPEAWTLVLTPKDERMGAILRRIALEGGKTLDRLALDEASGDTTRIRFAATTKSATAPAALAPFREQSPVRKQSTSREGPR